MRNARSGDRLRRVAAQIIVDRVDDLDTETTALLVETLDRWMQGRDSRVHAFILAPSKRHVWWAADQRSAAHQHRRLTAEGVPHVVIQVAFLFKAELAEDIGLYLRNRAYRRWFDRLCPAHREPSAAERSARTRK